MTMPVTVLGPNGEYYASAVRHWLDLDDPRSAAEQLDAKYQFGGFKPFPGYKLLPGNKLKYPGDPAMPPLAEIKFRDEIVLFYESEVVGVVSKGEFIGACRMD